MSDNILRQRVSALIKTYRANASRWRKEWENTPYNALSHARLVCSIMKHHNDYTANMLQKILKETEIK